jgi:hypothetical protein
MASRRVRRRHVLRASGLVGLSAIAGCSDSGDAGDGTPTGDRERPTDGAGDDGSTANAEPGSCTPGHTEGDPPCEQIAADAETLVRFDASGTPLLVSFTYPCGWQASVAADVEESDQVNASRFGIGSGDAQTFVDVQVRTSLEPVSADFLATERESGSYADVEYQYDGETRTAIVAEQSGDFDANYGATAYTTVPYEGKPYSVAVVPTVQGSACGVEVDALVVAMVQSLEPNPQVTA